MRIFNYSFLKTIELSPNFFSLASLIFTMKGKENATRKEYPSIYESLKQIAIVQSVKGSNAIEGIVATDKRIKELVLENSFPLDHTEQEIKGYQDALAVVHQNSLNIQFNEETIRSLHRLMGSRAQIANRGEWKKDDNVVTETLQDGSTRVRWNPVPALLTPQAMNDLVLAYRSAVSDSQINRLLLIPCVILDFLCVHPFDDGNGRVSRLLSLLLLNKADFDITRYVSFEEEINKDRGPYYQALEQSSLGWHENKNDYLPFVANFLTTLARCYQELDKRFLVLNGQKINKSERIEKMVLASFIPVSKKEIQDLLPDVSVTTIEAVLSKMVKENRIEKLGTYKNARYFKKQE
ncbi:MAG: Fic family protein [Bacilli bacterium]|jgi:Fic family protein|nr:Fic family protein [Bacilli bacterium]MCH4228641.1 Fic family protein [Bacilli bacterium]MCI2054731.1 Fic family protein [Bacilli bacterium]